MKKSEIFRVAADERLWPGYYEDAMGHETSIYSCNTITAARHPALWQEKWDAKAYFTDLFRDPSTIGPRDGFAFDHDREFDALPVPEQQAIRFMALELAACVAESEGD